PRLRGLAAELERQRAIGRPDRAGDLAARVEVADLQAAGANLVAEDADGAAGARVSDDDVELVDQERPGDAAHARAAVEARAPQAADEVRAEVRRHVDRLGDVHLQIGDRAAGDAAGPPGGDAPAQAGHARRVEVHPGGDGVYGRARVVDGEGRERRGGDGDAAAADGERRGRHRPGDAQHGRRVRAADLPGERARSVGTGVLGLDGDVDLARLPRFGAEDLVQLAADAHVGPVGGLHLGVELERVLLRREDAEARRVHVVQVEVEAEPGEVQRSGGGARRQLERQLGPARIADRHLQHAGAGDGVGAGAVAVERHLEVDALERDLADLDDRAGAGRGPGALGHPLEARGERVDEPDDV